MINRSASSRVVCLALALAASGAAQPRRQVSRGPMDAVAEAYVKLVLAMGQHDADYVDAYYGPPAWKKEADAAKLPLDTIAGRAAQLRTSLAEMEAPREKLSQLRHRYLDRQLAAMEARVRMLKGQRLSFDEESKALYDAVAPTHPESHFQAILDKLDKRFPGDGPLVARYEAFRRAFVIPRDKLDSVFQTAVKGCRERTVRHVELPMEESFTVEYVTHKSWSGYNWYQGGYRSLIQVNTDLPVYIDRAVDLACHEGYPGHHVYNALLEKHLVRDRGWVEFSVYALFSPQSLIAEGTANFGIEVAFPGHERVAYEKTTLFPLAGFDPSRADEYYEVQALVDQLSYAGNEAARRYIDGTFTAGQAADFLQRYALMPSDRATQRIKFFDQYRSYVINYNLGKDMVRQYIEKQGGTPANLAKRWDAFENLLSSPRLPSDLQ
jgi:hypothetical protein